MTPLLKPIRQPKPRKFMRRVPMNPIGRKGRARLCLNVDFKARAEREGWGRCEIAPILSARGIDVHPCLGELTFAHSVKGHKRGVDPVLAVEVCRACSFHHMSVLDLLRPALTAELVREAIANRFLL